MRVIAGARTDVGRVRDMNQDTYLIAEPLYGIADGMGGHAAGDVASQTAVSTVRSMFESRPPVRPQDLAAYLKEANSKVYRQATDNPQFQGMGTTFTLIHVDGERANLAHVGDSRAYLYRNHQLKQISKDHTLVQRMVDEGRISAREAPHHPQRNVISRALGIDDDVEVDTSSFRLLASDRLLICSDGLTSMLSDEQIASMLAADADPDELAERLVLAANEAGGEDNITVVILDVTDGDADERPSQRQATSVPPPPARDRATDDDAVVDDAPDDRTSAGAGWKRLALWIAIPAAVIVIAYIALQVALANSWFVGTTESGAVAIFNGRPEEIAGFSLREEYEVSDLQIDDLPAFLREDVDNGIEVDSLAAAEETIENLKQRSEDFGDPGASNRSD